MGTSKALATTCLLGLTAWITSQAATPVEPSRYPDLLKLIQPKAAEERWAGIPWQTSLWEARKQAARQGKPILLWEMDGHPLGCT